MGDFSTGLEHIVIRADIRGPFKSLTLRKVSIIWAMTTITNQFCQLLILKKEPKYKNICWTISPGLNIMF